jgi:Phosphorylated adapter RNA export protein, RNA-binding domain
MMETLTADSLAEILHEPKRGLLQRVLRVVGPDLVADVLVDTLQCEAHGGMLTKDGTRRRSPGGTFFQLMKDRVSGRQRWWLFAPKPARPRRRSPSNPQGPTWDEVQPLIAQLATTRAGEARVMKLTLIGRPGKVEIRKDCVLLRMQGKAPGNFPKGLPPVPKQAPLTWTVLVARRQWNRVQGSITTDQEDQLIIEGYPALQGTEHILLAQSCVSVAMQRAQKAAQGQQTPS